MSGNCRFFEIVQNHQINKMPFVAAKCQINACMMYNQLLPYARKTYWRWMESFAVFSFYLFIFHPSVCVLKSLMRITNEFSVKERTSRN